MTVTDISDRVGQFAPLGDSGPPDVLALLGHVERLAGAAERALSGYLAELAERYRKVEAAELAVAGAVADAMHVLGDDDRAEFVAGLDAMPGYTDPNGPEYAGLF